MSTISYAIAEDKLTYDVRDLPGVLGLNRTACYNLANRADFPAIRIGRRIIVPKDALRKWLEDQASRAE